MQHCFVDTTASSNGQERSLLDRLFETHPHLTGARRLVVVRNRDQFDDLDGYDGDLTRVAPVADAGDAGDAGEDPGGAGEQQVLAELDAWLKALDGDSGLVCSFRESVRDRVADLGLPEERLRFLDLRHVLRPKLAEVRVVTEWPNEVIPEAQAVTLLLQAMATAGRPLRLTDVRPGLERLDLRFHRDRTRPLATDNPKVIPLLVDIARRRGLVQVDGPSDNPVVTLTARGRTEYGIVARPAPRPGATRPAAGPGQVALADQPPQRPSDEYIQILRGRRFGPFQEVRGAVLDEIENLLPNRLSVGMLLDGAIDRVRKDVDAARADGRQYLIKNPEKNIPWSQVRAFLTVMITRCKVLLNGDTPVTGSARDRDTVVTGPVDRWRLRLEAELIVLLLESRCTIDVYSHEDLAGALFNSRQNLQPVEDCIAYLVETGRCEESGDQFTLTLVR